MYIYNVCIQCIHTHTHKLLNQGTTYEKSLSWPGSWHTGLEKKTHKRVNGDNRSGNFSQHDIVFIALGIKWTQANSTVISIDIIPRSVPQE